MRKRRKEMAEDMLNITKNCPKFYATIAASVESWALFQVRQNQCMQKGPQLLTWSRMRTKVLKRSAIKSAFCLLLGIIDKITDIDFRFS